METIQGAERVLKALANRRRLSIFLYLQHVERAPVGLIAKEIRLSLKATSKHLGIMYAADLVDKEQIALSVVYRLKTPLRPVTKTILHMLQ
jgi:DNA-binding transcriptional ArsR family regulator